MTLLDAVAAGRNVREPGEDLRAGDTVLARGTRLGPAELGVAINAGRATLCVRAPPARRRARDRRRAASAGQPARPRARSTTRTS